MRTKKYDEIHKNKMFWRDDIQSELIKLCSKIRCTHLI